MAKVTIEAVAKAAGVSKTAVSFVLNNRLPQANAISPETRERILAAAAALGYRKNPIAASLRTGTPLWIGVMGEIMLDDPLKWMWAPHFELSMLFGVQKKLSENGYFTLLGSRSGEDDVESLEILASSGIGGIILKSAGPKTVSKAEQMIAAGIPVVNVFPSKESDLYPYTVDLDNVRGGRMAAELLIKAGAKRPMCATLESTHHMLRKRTKGFSDAVNEASGRGPLVCEIPEGVGERASVKILSSFINATNPDAILAADAGISVLVEMAIEDLGLSTPDDVQIIGFDCYSFRTKRQQKLSSVGGSWWQAGQAAAGVILESIRTGVEPATPVTIDPLFVPGDSTPPELAQDASLRSGADPFAIRGPDVEGILGASPEPSAP